MYNTKKGFLSSALNALLLYYVWGEGIHILALDF